MEYYLFQNTLTYDRVSIFVTFCQKLDKYVSKLVSLYNNSETDTIFKLIINILRSLYPKYMKLLLFDSITYPTRNYFYSSWLFLFCDVITYSCRWWIVCWYVCMLIWEWGDDDEPFPPALFSLNPLYENYWRLIQFTPPWKIRGRWAWPGPKNKPVNYAA